MIKNKQYDEDGALEASFDCKYTDDEMGLLVNPDVDEKYVEKCIEHFNNLSDQLLDEICDALGSYYEDVRDEAEEVFGDLRMPEEVEGRDILNYCSPSSLIVEKPDSYDIIGYSVEGSCDWEPEHGFQIIIRNDKLIYVSSFDGTVIWGDDDWYDREWNYADFEPDNEA